MFILNNQVERVKTKLQRHIDKHDRALIIAKNVYSPDPAATVVFTKLYPHFALGYILNKATGYKQPYTVTYNEFICKAFDKRSMWEDGTSLYD